ncbi:MAG: VOC family protein [Kiloniellales bacterium]|nr:VOC family protein [Kiloniellales bacterium]
MTDDSQAGMTASVIPHLVVKGAADALEFYKRAFGMEETLRMASPSGDSIVHAELRHGNGTIYLADEFPQCQSPQALGGSPVTIHLHVKDVDSAFQQAVDAGAEAVMPPADMFWGDRYGKLRCPFGHEWSMAQHLRDVSMEEMQEGLKQAFADPQGG